MKPTLGQLSKLPLWAQTYIADIERQCFVSVRALNEYLDSQTESPFRYWDLLHTGEGQGPTHKTKFIQTNKMEVHWAGVELTVLIRPDQNELDLQWCAAEGSRIGEIALIPTSFGAARLKSKDHMR